MPKFEVRGSVTHTRTIEADNRAEACRIFQNEIPEVWVEDVDGREVLFVSDETGFIVFDDDDDVEPDDEDEGDA